MELSCPNSVRRSGSVSTWQGGCLAAVLRVLGDVVVEVLTVHSRDPRGDPSSSSQAKSHPAQPDCKSYANTAASFFLPRLSTEHYHLKEKSWGASKGGG